MIQEKFEKNGKSALYNLMHIHLSPGKAGVPQEQRTTLTALETGAWTAVCTSTGAVAEEELGSERQRGHAAAGAPADADTAAVGPASLSCSRILSSTLTAG